MERLSKTIGNLQSNLDALSSMIEVHTYVAGNVSFDIAEACTLRFNIETIQRNLNELKEIDTELEKVQNYNKASETFKEPKDREIKGKVPSTSESPKGNMVNHPLHYQSTTADGKNIECIDAMEAVKGWFNTAIFCELNAFKYNWRLGQKDFIPTELGKIKWYSDKASELWRNNLNWFYPKNQHSYAIIEEVKMKNPSTGEWQDSFLYTDGKGMYVREKQDFINNFKKS